MKSLFCLLLLVSLSVSAQTAFRRAAFRIDSLPKQGILLDKGWKFHAGDNPDFAKAEFDDSAWQPIDPTKDIMDLSSIFNTQIKWLRLHFEVKNKLPNILGIAINQAGASEIYLNGHLIHKIGHIDSDSNKIKAHDPLEYPEFFPADSVGHYCLAVRYALQPNIRYTQIYRQTKNRLFNATIVNLLSSLNTKRGFNRYYLGLEIFVVGIFFMLFVLHTAFYILQRSNKTHLLLATYILAIIMVRIFKLMGENQFSVEYRYFNLNISNCLLAISVICLASVYYRIAKVRFDDYYYILIAFQLIYVVVSIFNYGFPWQTILLLIGAIYGFIIAIRMTRLGSQKDIKGFLIVSIGILFTVFGLISRTIAVIFLNYGISATGYNILNYGISPILVELIFTLGAVSIPISLSLFMSIGGSEVNKALNKQLLENEQLKNKAIEQEKEKQQILAAQNDTLEKLVNERTSELKASQNQLIQKEKLASLGELTAGIAHEIQNPLNFVNNFSEMSVELAQELKEEAEKPEIDKDLIIDLANDLAQNQQKINHHGKRASSIVSGMLEHSRTSTGERALTDLNKLADEYLRLSYHGMRAKNNGFNADYELIADSTLPLINVVPQDIGRVLLNLINNAFYAAYQSKKPNPKVIVSTAFSPPYGGGLGDRRFGGVEIRVQDNGNGIPADILPKIFQPFFTTKPTGEGTGLGLSLAYDIVIKGHGGTLEVESVDGEGTTFIVKLPIQLS